MLPILVTTVYALFFCFVFCCLFNATLKKVSNSAADHMQPVWFCSAFTTLEKHQQAAELTYETEASAFHNSKPDSLSVDLSQSQAALSLTHLRLWDLKGCLLV